MSKPRPPRIALVALFALAASIGSPAHARGLDLGCFLNRLVVRIKIAANRFNTWRDLTDYGDHFGAAFLERIYALGPSGHWVDAGAGDGLAIGQFAEIVEPRWRAGASLNAWPDGGVYEKRSKRSFSRAGNPEPLPLLTGLSRSIPRRSRRVVQEMVEGSDGRIRYLDGRYVEDIPAAEIGSADVITDLFGPITYTHRLDTVLNRYLEILKDGGTLFSESAVTITKIETSHGQVNLIDWLQSFDGPELKVQEYLGTVSITRLPGSTFRFPRLELVRITAETPPRRVFRVVVD